MADAIYPVSLAKNLKGMPEILGLEHHFGDGKVDTKDLRVGVEHNVKEGESLIGNLHLILGEGSVVFKRHASTEKPRGQAGDFSFVRLSAAVSSLRIVRNVVPVEVPSGQVIKPTVSKYSRVETKRITEGMLDEELGLHEWVTVFQESVAPKIDIIAGNGNDCRAVMYDLDAAQTTTDI